MRENIGLYRGKRIDSDKWLYGSLLKVTIDGETAWLIFGDAFEFANGGVRSLSHAPVDPETVGQYTGRIDKNKKRVFEGDIIRLCNGLPGFDVGVILWDTNYQAYLIVSDPVGKVILDDFGNYGRPEYYEVIGNIRDNLELLEDAG